MDDVYKNLNVRRNQLFDFQSGLNYKPNKSPYNSFSAYFRYNSFKATCNNFYGDGQLIRFFNTYSLSVILARDFKIPRIKHTTYFGLGIEANKMLINPRVLRQKQYFKPGSTYGATYTGLEQMQLTSDPVNFALQIRLSRFVLISPGNNIEVYANLSADLNSWWSYKWIFMNQVFASGKCRRISPQLGFRVPLHAKNAL
jgi:hypothetical protein